MEPVDLIARKQCRECETVKRLTASVGDAQAVLDRVRELGQLQDSGIHPISILANIRRLVDPDMHEPAVPSPRLI